MTKKLEVRVFQRKDVGLILQKIYDEEQNIQINSFWDSGYQFKIGDEFSGYWFNSMKDMPHALKSYNLNFSKVEDFATGLAYVMALLCPQSMFRRWYDELNVEEYV